MTTETYLDHASATPLHARAREAFLDALDRFGDPLRLHRQGMDARRLLDESRAAIAEALGAQPDEIVFTSGGTESVALAIWGGVRPVREIGTRIVTTTVEHPAVGGVLSTLETDGFESIHVAVDEDGRLDLDRFGREVRTPGTLLASVHHANHEVGTMQQVAEAALLCREGRVLLHTDACQTVGRLPVDVHALDVDLLSLSAHKFGGPAGVGALYVRRGVPIAAYPCGDDRERRRRSGMENVPGIAAMAAALAVRLTDMADQAARQWSLTDRIRAGIAERRPRCPRPRPPDAACSASRLLLGRRPGRRDPEHGARRPGVPDRGGLELLGRAGDASPVLEHIGYPGHDELPDRDRSGHDREPTSTGSWTRCPRSSTNCARSVRWREAAMARYGAERRIRAA